MFTKKHLLTCAVAAALLGGTSGQSDNMGSGAQASGSLFLKASGLDASGFSAGTSTGFSNSDFSGGASTSESDLTFNAPRFGRAFFRGEADSETQGGGGSQTTFGGSGANTAANGRAVQIPGVEREVDLVGGGGAMVGAAGENEVGFVFDMAVVSGDTNRFEGIEGEVTSDADSLGGATNEGPFTLFAGADSIERFNDFIAGFGNRKLLQSFGNILALESGGGASLSIENGASGAAGQANFGSAFDGVFFEGTQTVSGAEAGVSEPGFFGGENRAAAGGGAAAGNDCRRSVFAGFEITDIPDECGQFAESRQIAAASNDDGEGTIRGSGESNTNNAPSGYTNQLSVATNEQDGSIDDDGTSVSGGFSGAGSGRATNGAGFGALAAGFATQAFDTARNIGPAFADISDTVFEFTDDK